jgi:paraquat-inducible protein B
VNAAAKRKQWGKLTWIVPFSAAIAFGWILFRKYVIDRRLLAST